MMKEEKIFAGLDTLRALAITLVFLFHYTFFQHPAWMDKYFHFGWVGVDLFFVFSGFLISNQLFAEWQKRNKIDVRIFYLKRAFRILPPYLFILLMYIFIPAFHERESLPPLWKMFTFTQNFNQNIDVYGTFSHSWSLCVEEQFYLLLPIILILIFSSRLKKISGWLLPGIFILTLVMRWITWHFYLAPLLDSDDFSKNWYRWIYYPTYTRLDGLIVGVGIASIYRFRAVWLVPLKKYANGILLAGLVVFGACYFLGTDPEGSAATIFSFSLIALAFGLFVLSAVLPGSFLFKFKSALVKNIATLSYSLYLSHKGIIHLTQRFLKGTGIKGDSIAMLLICICLCILGAFLMRVIIEKPFLKLRNIILEKRELSWK